MLTWIKYTFFFLILLTLQVLVFDHIYVFEFNRPVIFFYFILILPVMPTAALMIFAFLTGLTYDLFQETIGINAAACVLLAFIREPLLKFIKNEDEEVLSAHLNYLGPGRFISYIATMSVLFHLIVTFLTIFSLKEMNNSMIRAGLGAGLSIVLLFVIDIIFFYRKQTT